MEAFASSSHQVQPIPKFQPNTERIKQRLLKNGVFPTPRIVHTLRKKAIQKHNRKQSKGTAPTQDDLPPAQRQALLEDAHFEKLKREYKDFIKAVNFPIGLPWEGVERVQLRELASGRDDYDDGVVRIERLRELGEIFEGRTKEELQWVLEDDDVELGGRWPESEGSTWDPVKSRKKRTESEALKLLVTRLSARKIDIKDWKFSRMMKQSELQFTEEQLLKILEGLGNNRHWIQAMSVVDWVYDDKHQKRWKSRFVYTKLLAVLGKARRPQEALKIFNRMREDFHIYPDMAAYHSIAVTLGQSGLVKELLHLIESMRQKPLKKIKNLCRKGWDPVLEPDLVVYNAVLNACVPSHQWKGVSWVFEQLRMSGMKPNGATYGLAMEVMLQSGKYELVHEFFRKMKRSGEAPRAITYKVLVTSLWREGKVDEAVQAVRDMERRGVVGTASVYYELACCLCNNGRWREAVLEVMKLKRLPRAKPLEVTFTGLIISSMEGGHINDCISLFRYMKTQCGCNPNIGTINTMLRIYGRNDMFSEAKKLFDELKGTQSCGGASSVSNGDSHVLLVPDEYTYSLMLEGSAISQQWEYFEYIYKEMTFMGYRLDPTKYSYLLVMASRAGKGYLLEHAFDLILEAGEVPQPSVFLEMVFQATVRCDYERAVTLITVMAHASFQVTEKQWTELFGRNNRGIPEECRANLLAALRNCPLSNEVTVTNLSRSLNFLLCSAVGSGEISKSLGKEPGNSQSTDLAGRRNLGDSTTSVPALVGPDRESSTERHHLAGEGCSGDMGCPDTNGIGRILSAFRLDDNLEEEEAEDDDDCEELGLEYDSDDDDDDDEELDSGLPSAEEILRMWKESRQ